MKLSRRGLIATIVYHTLLVLLLVFAGLTFPDPPPEEEGILVNFGTDETGFGDFEPRGDDQQAGDPDMPIVQETQEIVEESEPLQEVVESYTPPDPTPVDNTQDVEETRVKEDPKPTAEELAEIAIASADTAKVFGIEPRVAMLSYSSGESGSGEEVERVRTATQLARKRRPKMLLEGPIQYDAAVDEAVGRSKIPGSKVAGRATVLIFPDLNTGNNTYKAVQRETGAIAVGPVLQGLNKPVNDLSRGCTVDDIINTVAITAIQAQQVEKEQGAGQQSTNNN